VVTKINNGPESVKPISRIMREEGKTSIDSAQVSKRSTETSEVHQKKENAALTSDEVKEPEPGHRLVKIAEGLIVGAALISLPILAATNLYAAAVFSTVLIGCVISLFVAVRSATAMLAVAHELNKEAKSHQ